MIYVKYYTSSLIWGLLNPFGLWQCILQTGGQMIAILRSRMLKINSPSISMSLPFTGYWTVVNGGVDKSSSHSWGVINQRYAYDFVGKDGENYTADGRKAESYYAFGQDVLAPADGIVIKAQNNMRDYHHAGTGWVDICARDMCGNYIIIRHTEDVFSLIAHLKRDSCVVKVGNIVKQGQMIAQCGNSGISSEPHIHFHVQDRQNFYTAVGLPILFKNVEIENKASQTAKKVEYGYISKNCRVRNFTPAEELPNESYNKIPPAKSSLLPLLTGLLSVLGLLVCLHFVYIWFIQPLLFKGG